MSSDDTPSSFLFLVLRQYVMLLNICNGSLIILNAYGLCLLLKSGDSLTEIPFLSLLSYMLSSQYRTLLFAAFQT